MAPSPGWFRGFSIVALALAMAGCGSVSHTRDADELRSAAMGSAGTDLAEARRYIALLQKRPWDLF
jgi:uncharacterized protein YceK